MEDPCASSWRELDHYVREKLPSRVGIYSVSRDSIDHLMREGWRVEARKIVGDGRIDRVSKKIIFNRYLTGFQRDVTLFHEIVHVLYPNLNDSPARPNTFNCAIVEWHARQSRSNPELLRHALSTFGLEFQVYDRASYDAFPEIAEYNWDKQLAFPFAEECFRELRERVLMK